MSDFERSKPPAFLRDPHFLLLMCARCGGTNLHQQAPQPYSEGRSTGIIIHFTCETCGLPADVASCAMVIVQHKGDTRISVHTLAGPT